MRLKEKYEKAKKKRESKNGRIKSMKIVISTEEKKKTIKRKLKTGSFSNAIKKGNRKEKNINKRKIMKPNRNNNEYKRTAKQTIKSTQAS